jgi:hypothetical protein
MNNNKLIKIKLNSKKGQLTYPYPAHPRLRWYNILLSFVSIACKAKCYGRNDKTLLHHGKSKAKWWLVHCLPNVASKKTYAYAMSSVHLLIGMHRK